MPLHHVLQRAGQRGVVEGPGQAQRDGAVVARVAGAQPVQEPQALLGEGQGQRPGAVRPRDALRGGGAGGAGSTGGPSGEPAAERFPQVLRQGLGAV
ncbi:hypothetical protein GCM10010368_61830 [Streptomyces roseiscleroticus]|uniref:Uncharacterized protein n=1 Tax=Streptomyces roseiscleroticus TaxID=1972 RepID=A0ABN3F2H6_9ACTN